MSIISLYLLFAGVAALQTQTPRETDGADVEAGVKERDQLINSQKDKVDNVTPEDPNARLVCHEFGIWCFIDPSHHRLDSHPSNGHKPSCGNLSHVLMYTVSKPYVYRVAGLIFLLMIASAVPSIVELVIRSENLSNNVRLGIMFIDILLIFVGIFVLMLPGANEPIHTHTTLKNAILSLVAAVAVVFWLPLLPKTPVGCVPSADYDDADDKDYQNWDCAVSCFVASKNKCKPQRPDLINELNDDVAGFMEDKPTNTTGRLKYYKNWCDTRCEPPN
jgi:hypothetical protein